MLVIQNSEFRITGIHAGVSYALLSVSEVLVVPGQFSLRPPGPPQLSPDWSMWIMIVAVLFIVSVIMFYAYVH